ncbi:MAG: extracellular solute-binding protein [Paenibacillaceae bacterium]|nr:extracellular solute-binding protein [Paenibacillaceae bacterium]
MQQPGLRKKQLLLLAVTLAVTATAAGCSKSGGGSGEGAASPSATAGGELKPTNGKFDPPVTITTVRGMPAAATYKNGETADNNVHYKWAKDKLGIEIKNLWSVVDTNAAYGNKLKLALSANEELPDILYAEGQVAQLLIESGKFQDAGALFDKYASETWKNAMKEDPSVWNEYARGGKRYGIPMLDYDYNNDPVLWVREDWAQKLNVQAPKTLDDYEKLLDAFTNGDPDGNGKKDTYGVAPAFKATYNDSFNLGWVFGAYGALPNTWTKAADGTLAYGSVQPQIKQGLAKLRDWAAKGYIPTEAGLWDAGKAGAFMAAGKAGTFSGPYWSEAWPMGDMSKNDPNAKFVTYPLPTGSDGKSMHFSTHPYKGGLFINKSMKHPEVFFAYANYLFDNEADPKAGSEFENGWAKGYDWDLVDGKVTTDLTKIPGGGVRVFFYSLLPQGARIPSQNVKALVKLAQTGKPETPYESYWNTLAPDIEKKSATNVWNQKQFAVRGEFTAGTTATMQEKGDYLNKLEMETFGAIIAGSKPLDEFDKFVQTWKAQGGDKITQEVNEWYKSVAQK